MILFVVRNLYFVFAKVLLSMLYLVCCICIRSCLQVTLPPVWGWRVPGGCHQLPSPPRQGNLRFFLSSFLTIMMMMITTMSMILMVMLITTMMMVNMVTSFLLLPGKVISAPSCLPCFRSWWLRWRWWWDDDRDNDKDHKDRGPLPLVLIKENMLS